MLQLNHNSVCNTQNSPIPVTNFISLLWFHLPYYETC